MACKQGLLVDKVDHVSVTTTAPRFQDLVPTSDSVLTSP